MDWPTKKSVAAFILSGGGWSRIGQYPNRGPPSTRTKLTNHLFGLLECFTIQLVVRPASLSPIVHDAGILEHLEMERQPRLRRVERVLQLADAALAADEQLDDAYRVSSDSAWNICAARALKCGT